MVKQSIFVLAVLAGSAMAQTNLGPIVTTQQDDIGRATAPANPPAGKCRRYFNSVTGKETWINSSGGNCGGIGTGTIGGSGTTGSYTGWLDPADITNAPATYVGNDTTFAGNTTANGSVSSANNGVNAGSAQITGNTTQAVIPATNYVFLMGPNSASFNSWGLQFLSTPPTAGQYLAAGTPAPCTNSATATCIPLTPVTPPASPSVYTLQVGGVALAAGDTVNLNNSTPAAPSNGLNIRWTKSTAAGVDSVSAAVVGDGNAAHWLDGTGNYTAPLSQGGGGLPAPQIGDTIRYNVLGDGQWNAGLGGSRNTAVMYDSPGLSGPAQYGNFGNTNVSSISNTAPGNFPTATNSASRDYTSSASASTSTVVGETAGGATSWGIWGFGSFYRWAFRFKPDQTTNARYWMGMATYDTGGTGTETSVLLGNTSMATDTPSRHLLGFRYSATTDTNWECVASTGSGGGQTATSTGVAPDIVNAHTFEITYDGTTENCFIDGVLKVAVTTNVPAGAQHSMMMFWSGDNKNTANVVSGTAFWMALELK